jgi:hypothetical protein
MVFERLTTITIGRETQDGEIAGIKMNRKAAVQTAGHKTQQDLTHSTSIQSPFPTFQVKIQFKMFLQ